MGDIRPPPQLNATAESILSDAARLIEQSRIALAALAAGLSPDNATFANTLLPFIQHENQRLREEVVLKFYQYVGTDDQVRAASRTAEAQFSMYEAEIAGRKDLFVLVQSVHDLNENLGPESRKMLERQLQAFKSNGLGLTEMDQNELRQIKQEISTIRGEFERNVSEEESGVWLTREELQGVPDEMVSGLDTRNGKIFVHFSGGVFNSVLRYACLDATRRRVYIANANRCHLNVALFRKTVLLRDRFARILGYDNHAELRFETKLETSTQKINALLQDLQVKLVAKAKVELQSLKLLKQSDFDACGEAREEGYFLWDHKYYSRLLLERDLAVDEDEIAEYFTLDATINGMLNIFAAVFGMRFVRHENAGSLWHQDVKLFGVWDTALDPEQSQNFLGYLYMDLHPRPGKYRGAAALPITPGYIDQSGDRQTPATCLTCNFSKSTETRPSLLKHRDVVLLFHELGHCVHDLVSKTEYARFSGAETAQDFNEAPSQMLECWCWTVPTLQALSHHYALLSAKFFETWKREHGISPECITLPAKEMPISLIDNLIRSKNVTGALYWLEPLRLSVFDMMVHQPHSPEVAQAMNITEIYNVLGEGILQLDGPEKQGEGYLWGHGHATNGYLFRNLDAGFYAYLSSRVYALDMFYTAFKVDPMNVEQGLRYRRLILEKGGGGNEMEMLTQFLGRPPRSDAFFEDMGLS